MLKKNIKNIIFIMLIISMINIYNFSISINAEYNKYTYISITEKKKLDNFIELIKNYKNKLNTDGEYLLFLMKVETKINLLVIESNNKTLNNKLSYINKGITKEIKNINNKKTSNNGGLFESSFEKVEDFKGFYITPQGHKGTSFQELSELVVRSGKFSHKAWVDGINKDSTVFVNNNHRAYPTVQLHKTEFGSFQTPVLTTLWVWVDMDLKNQPEGENDWLSLATFTDDSSDSWKRTVLVNLNADGYIHLMHTVGQGKGDYIFQNKDTKFPQKEWVELKIYLDFSKNGYAKVWQNGELVSYAKIGNITDKIAQAHFGLYAPPRVSSGVIYNDDLKIEMVNGE